MGAVKRQARDWRSVKSCSEGGYKFKVIKCSIRLVFREESNARKEIRKERWNEARD